MDRDIGALGLGSGWCEGALAGTLQHPPTFRLSSLLKLITESLILAAFQRHNTPHYSWDMQMRLRLSLRTCNVDRDRDSK